MKININADIGESYGRYSIGNDSELMQMIGSANIACGMHAGDPTIMMGTIRLAIDNRVSMGAHPGFNDIWGFGRRQIRMRPLDLEYLVTYQIGALKVMAETQGAHITHVKPHGALNNMAHDDLDYALAIGRAIRAVDRDLIYVANATSQMTKAGEQLGLPVANEAYVDRVYDDNGKMASREREDAVIRDPGKAASQVLSILENKALTSANGRRIPVDIHSFCIHGDEPTAVPLMREVRRHLAHAGIEVVSLPDLFGFRRDEGQMRSWPL
ncbi:5-oxoprolinase subunit PxpA [Labrys sp. KNU-23]|uniref:LamB/YcsF family protein n=1 Tax=Labrys sp. KNU-23 TaxID=2789216 RepID=UPI0011ED71AA|nr:5-oxoprolinase subunit PxpA [Labrys sp. KNU-23]QEN86019.1 5-oxoprolinase subunit PxpA [Labrys sp. KNU-23]